MKTNFKAKKVFNLTQQARMRVVLTAFICGAFGNAHALPFGEQVQAGNLTFERGAQFLNINQTSRAAIANWQSFSIAVNESVRLNQPAQGVALFRVIGSDSSQIFGSLSATGSLFLSNPNGVLFGRGAQVDVGSLVATSMRISDSDFLAGNYQFHADGNAGVVNEGIIRTEDGGYVALLGNAVENSGTLQANNGSVILGSAQSAMLDIYGDGLVRVKLDGDALNAVINQTGNIIADGGAVQLATNARTAAINVDGVIQANSLVERNGVIRLEGGKNSTTIVSGRLEASGKIVGSKGGYVAVTGERVALLDGATIDVSGPAGGGTALIGGDYQGKNTNIHNAERTYIASTATIKADALDSGDGGKVIVWADDITRYYGSISAKGGAVSGNGGFAEVSGKRILNFLGKADLSAANGLGGNLLLDPLNITLTTADANTTGFTPPGDIAEAFADDAGLASTFRVNAGGSFAGITAGSTITLQATNDITVASAFNVATATGTANNSLVLQANNNINVNADVTTTGTGSITMNANADNTGGGNLAIGANITSQTGGIALSGVNITRTAGSIASTGAAGALNGGSINLSATGAITLGAATITANGSGAATAGTAGKITLSAVTGISSTGAITATGGASTGANQIGGNGGLVSVNNTGTGSVSVGAITASGGTSGTGNAAGGNAGSVTVANSGGNITAGALTARTGTGIGTGTDSVQGFITVNNTSASGTVTTGAINTAGNTNGHGGNVTLAGNNAVTVTGTLNTNGGSATGTRAGRNAGNVTIAGVNRSITGAITASGGAAIGAAQAGGNAGLVSITGTGTLNAVAINAQTGAATTTGAGGTVGGITLNGSTVVAGALTTTGGSNGNAGNIGVTSTGNMTVAAIAATGGGALAGVAGRNAGTVTLNSAGTVTATTIAANGNGGNGATLNLAGGNAAAINITGVGGVTTTTVAAIGGGASTTNAAGGNAGAITIANSGTGNIGVTTLTAQAGTTTGTGASGAAANILVTNTAAGGNLTATNITTTGNASANGGNVTLSSLGTTTAGAIATSGATSTGIRAGRTGGNVSVAGAVVTTGAITANGAAGIGLNQAGGNAGAVSLTATTGAIVTQAISAIGGNGIATNGNGGNGGAVNLDAGAGSTISMNTITTTGGNRSGTGIAGNAGNITVADNALLSADTIITATGGTAGGTSGTVNFGGTINSSGANRALTINTTAATTLAGAIGNTLALTSITTNASGTTAINGGAVTTTSTQTYNDAVTLGAATTFTTTNNNVTFGNTINAATNNGVIAAGTGAVTATTATNNFGNLAITAGSANIRDTNAIVLGATNVTGAYALQTAGPITQSAAVTMGGATTLNAGAANNITLNNVTNNFNTVAITSGQDVSLVDANALTVNASTVRTMTARTLSSDLTLGGNITATGAGNAIVLASAANFINASNSTLTPGTGRWLVHSTSPLLDTRGALLTTASDFKQYNTAFGGSILGSGDGFIYTLAPTITPTLTGTAVKTYNGTIAAPTGSLALNGTTGAIDGDIVTLGGLTSATYDTANAGTGKTVSASGISLTSAANGVKPVFGYQLVSNTATGAVGSINQANLTVSTNNVVKTYDGLTTAAGTATVTSGTLFNNASNGGALDTLSGGTFAFTNPNVGLGNKTVTVAGVTVNDGNAGGNYNVIFANNTTSTINTANLTVTANNQVKTYGNTFTFAGTEFISSGLQNGEIIGSATLTSAGAVNSANVASYAIAPSAATGGTFNASNYAISYVNGTMTVNPAIIDLSGTRTYNATTAFNAATFGTINGVLGQTLNLAGISSVASANAGAAQILTTGTLALTNGTGLASNYTLMGGTHNGTITQASLNLNAVTDTKTYDGNTNSASVVSVVGLFGTDNLTSLSQSFASKNVLGANGSTLNVDPGYTVNDGNGGNNYTIATNSNTGTINPLAITGSITANNKVYDGNNTATIATRNLAGVIGLDDVSYIGGTATFANKNAATGKTVTGIGLSLGGADAGNYTVNTTAATIADIAKADITAVTGITANNKMYDATTTAGLNTSTAAYTGMIGGESLTVATAAGNFSDANAGTGKTVNVSGISLGGADAGNYNLTTTTASTTADISQRAITVTVNPGQSKTFGAADPLPFAFTVGGFGLVGVDTLTGALDRAAGEVVGSYAINQGSLLASSNYLLTYVGNNFNILTPSTTGGGNPRNGAGLVDLNPALGNYTNQQLFVLNVGATAAGVDSEGNQQACEGDPEKLAKDKEFVLMLNYGVNLPKGVNTSCDKATL